MEVATSLTFRHLRKKHHLGGQIYCFAEDFGSVTVRLHLSCRGMAMGQARIAAPQLHLFEGAARVCRRHENL